MTSLSNYAQLRSYTYTPGNEVVYVQGCSALGDGGQGDFYWDPSSTQADNSATILQVTSPSIIPTGRWKRVFYGTVSIKWFGAKGNGSTDDTAAFSAALNYCVNNNGGVIALQSGDTYKISNTLTLNAGYTCIEGNGAVIFAAIENGSLFDIISTLPEPYNQCKNYIKGISITAISSATYPNTIGLNFTGASTGMISPAHFAIQNLSLKEFGIGCNFGNQAYCLNFDTINVERSKTCLYSTTTANSGERLSFINSSFFASDLAFDISNSNGEYFFTNCSLDYNLKMGNIVGARVYIYNSHIEADFKQIPFTVAGNGGLLYVSGGVIVAHSASSFPYVVQTTQGSNQVSAAAFVGCFIHNMATTSGYFGEGANITVDYLSGFYQSQNSPLLSKDCNHLFSGSFEDGIIDEAIFIQSGLSEINFQTRDTNLTLNITTVEHRTGTKCLALTKVHGPGWGPAIVAVAIPINTNSRPGFEFYLKGSGLTGTAYISRGYATLVVRNDIKKVTQFSSPGSYNVDVSTITNWTRVPDGPLQQSPPWATHFVLFIDISHTSAGTIYLDDLLITNM